MATRDDSVMTAIGELRRLEEERTEVLRQAAAARQREAHERAAREQAAREAERERERMIAEAEATARARTQVEGELQRDRSLEVLRQQIAAVQAEREAVREELRARIDAASIASGARRGPWALAFGLSSVVAAGLAGVLVMQQQAPLEIARADVAAIERTPGERATPAREGVAPEPRAEPAAPATIESALPPAPRAAVQPRTRTRQRARERPPETRTDELSEALGLDHDDGDEVLSEQFLRDATRHR